MTLKIQFQAYFREMKDNGRSDISLRLLYSSHHEYMMNMIASIMPANFRNTDRPE
jgi:hypothetical protein